MKRIIFVAMLLAVAACEKKQEASEAMPPATMPPETTMAPMTTATSAETTVTAAETTSTAEAATTTTQKSSGAAVPGQPPDSAQSAGASQSPGAVSAGSGQSMAAAGSGDYTVSAGDTLGGIAREHNLDYRDVARWNNIADPNRISTGQTLRLSAP